MSAKSVLYLKHPQIIEVGTGKIAVGQGKHRDFEDGVKCTDNPMNSKVNL